MVSSHPEPGWPPWRSRRDVGVGAVDDSIERGLRGKPGHECMSLHVVAVHDGYLVISCNAPGLRVRSIRHRNSSALGKTQGMQY